MKQRKLCGKLCPKVSRLPLVILVLSLTFSLSQSIPIFENGLDFEPIIFDESIFKEYHEEFIPQKQVKIEIHAPVPSKNRETISKLESANPQMSKRLSIFKVKSEKNRGLILKPQLNKKVKNSFEKMLQLYVGRGMSVDSRKLSEIRCNNTFVKSYIDLEEEEKTMMEHPRVAEWKMLEICENNKTTCCNMKENEQIRTIFNISRDKIKVLLPKFQKILLKLSKEIFRFDSTDEWVFDEIIQE